MIFKGNSDQFLLYYGNIAINSVYKGLLLIWQAIRSCFGNGYWDNDKPWDNEDGWTN